MENLNDTATFIALLSYRAIITNIPFSQLKK